MSKPGFELSHHQHGKSRVRVARTWREGSKHYFVEWNVAVVLKSECEESFTGEDNSRVIATDTTKNTVYVVAKECKERLSMEEFGIKLARHFFDTYPQIVTGVTVRLEEKPWERVSIDGIQHDHGFKLGMEKHTAEIAMTKGGKYEVKTGIEGLAVLKTTQAGFEGFYRDKYTTLPEVNDRIAASSIRAIWSYSGRPKCYTAAYTDIKDLICKVFYGPPKEGVYSPSLQSTLYLISKAVLERFPEVESCLLNMPNLHFLPFNAPAIGVPFKDDVYTPTDEPHGSIEACLTRTGLSRVHSRL